MRCGSYFRRSTLAVTSRRPHRIYLRADLSCARNPGYSCDNDERNVKGTNPRACKDWRGRGGKTSPPAGAATSAYVRPGSRGVHGADSRGGARSARTGPTCGQQKTTLVEDNEVSPTLPRFFGCGQGRWRQRSRAAASRSRARGSGCGGLQSSVRTSRPTCAGW